MKYRDSIREIADRIKAKCTELINKFKELPMFRKLAVLLGRLIQAVSIVFMYRGTRGIAEELKVVRALNEQIYKEWKEKEKIRQPMMFEGWESAGEDETPAPKPPSYIEGKYLEHGMRILHGFIGVLIGTLTAELAHKSRTTDSMRVNDSVMDKVKDILMKFKSIVRTIIDKFGKFLENNGFGKVVRHLIRVLAWMSAIKSYKDFVGFALGAENSIVTDLRMIALGLRGQRNPYRISTIAGLLKSGLKFLFIARSLFEVSNAGLHSMKEIQKRNEADLLGPINEIS